jgi:hypothetical protein
MSGLIGHDPSQAGRIGYLSAVKRLHTLVEANITEDDKPWTVNRDRIENIGSLQEFYLGKLVQEDEEGSADRVIVEKKYYDEHYSIESVAQELFARLKAIVLLLNAAQSFPVLRCRGWYHHMGTYSLGLVYDYPKDPSLEPTTLFNILGNDKMGRYRPLLGDIFRLANCLATSLSEFHKVDWVHKSISSLMIVFFKPRMAEWKDYMIEPFFVGFLTSRQNDKFSFTEGPSEAIRKKNICVQST